MCYLSLSLSDSAFPNYGGPIDNSIRCLKSTINFVLRKMNRSHRSLPQTMEPFELFYAHAFVPPRGGGWGTVVPHLPFILITLFADVVLRAVCS